MFDFYNIIDDKELENKLAETESDIVIKYIFDLDKYKQDIFLKRIKKYLEKHT